MEDPMRVVCDTTGARAAGIYRRWYLDSKIFNLECMGKWENSRKCPETLRPEDLPPKIWVNMNASDRVFIDASDLKSSAIDSSLYVLPLFFEEHPFGFIALFGIEKQGLERFYENFIGVLCNIFELWVCKINLKKRFEDVVDFIPNPTFIMTTDEKIVSWNSANEEMTGWKADQLIGKDNYESSVPYYFVRRPMVANLIMSPDSKWEQTYYEFERKGDKVNSLAFCPALPGGGAYLRTNTLRLYDANHRLWGAIHTVRDVTLERQMREKLQRSESMYRAISDFAGVGILLFKDDEVVYFNEQIIGFMNLNDKEISRRDFINWIHPDDRKKMEESITVLLKEKMGPLRLELRAFNATKLRYYNVYIQLITYEDQNAIHFILDDISEQKEIERRERQNELRLYHEGRLTSLGIMAAGIAHELNQPLNTIRVVTDGYLFGKDKGWELDHEDLYEGLEMISRQVARMSDVIHNIRNFARDDRDATFTDVNVNAAVENVFSMIGRQLEAHDITVKKQLKPNLSPIKAHLNRLEQVIMNLLVNSRQALDSCQKTDKMLWVKTGIRKGFIFIEVGDNATGIPPDLMAKIFDPFVTTREVGQGTGLGLTISQSIVTEFRGQMRASNNDKGGATFTVMVPAAGGGA